MPVPVQQAAPLSPARPDPWAVHLPQFRSAGLPDGIPWGPDNGNCGPAAIVNALRLVGLDVPGFSGERSQSAIDAARVLATGNSDSGEATLKTQQAFALRAGGADVHVTYRLEEALAQARAGAVVLLGGNRATGSWPRRPDDPPPGGVSNHAAVIAGYQADQDAYIVSDPAFEAPVLVGAAQIAAFSQVDAEGYMPRLGLLVRGPANPASATAAAPAPAGSARMPSSAADAGSTR